MSWWWCHMVVSVSFDKICNSSRGINALFLIRKNTNSQNEVTFIRQELRRGMSQINLFDILFLRWLICWKLFYIIYQLDLSVKKNIARLNINSIWLLYAIKNNLISLSFNFFFEYERQVKHPVKHWNENLLQTRFVRWYMFL